MVMKLAAGQGKTVVFFMFMMMLNKHDAITYKNFLILTSSRVLQKQLDELILIHELKDVLNVKIHVGGDFDRLPGIDFTIIDEADLVVR
jgi:uncharacterized protein YbcV (DUF1398 family)